MPRMSWVSTNLAVSPRWAPSSVETAFGDDKIYIDADLGPLPERKRHDSTWILRTIKIFGQFALGRGDQPATETLFASSPIVVIDGQITLNSGILATGLFGLGSSIEQVEWRLKLRQTGRLNDRPILMSDGNLPKSQTPFFAASVPRRGWAEVTDVAALPVRFPPLNIWLNGTEDLSVDLDVAIEYLVRGAGASIHLGPSISERAFWFRLPEWNLIDVRETL